jgi:integrase
MSWIESRKGWMKEYKGHKYAISCRQLGAPETKEGSRQLANEWWTAKRAEIDLVARRTPAPMEDIAGAVFGDPEMFASPEKFHRAMFRFHTNIVPQLNIPAEQMELFNRYHQYFHQYIQRQVEPMTAAQMEEFRAGSVSGFLESAVEGRSIPQRVIEQLPPARQMEIEAGLKALRGEPAVSQDRTVKAQAEAWLDAQRIRVEAKQMSAGRCANNRTCLEHFVTFLGPNADVGGIDANKLIAYKEYCLKQVAARHRAEGEGWAEKYAQDVLNVAKSFVRGIAEKEVIPLPSNITSKNLTIKVPHKAIQTWTVEEFHYVVSEAPGKLKLALLLMANCGFTQSDISDLVESEVDWRAGRIIRKRSKTKGCENVPVVNWKLWDVSFELLKRYRSAPGSERVLLTESGKPYLRVDLNAAEKQVKADGFASCYVHLKKRLKFDKPLKQLRKLSATVLESHKDYGRYKVHFLDQSPRLVADKHYSKPDQKLFDQAVTWLGKQLKVDSLEA